VSATDEFIDDDAAARESGQQFPVERKTPYQVIERVLLDQERIRGLITLSLVALFAVIVLFAGFHTGSKEEWERVKEWLHLVLLALTGILGLSLGFYFSGVVSVTRR
jgi:hypothetical protein